MQILLPTFFDRAQADRENSSYRLIALALAVATTAVSWLLILIVGCFAFGIAMSTTALLGVVLTIAIVSGVGPILVSAAR
jgi:hypothetical protein